MQIDTNPYLAAVMRAVRAGRPPLPADQPFFNRVEKVPAGNYVEVWFRTGGCTWDHAGGCTMCNYGYGDDVSATSAVESVRAALADLRDEPHELMISPSGGMWDGREVPAESLPAMYELAQAAGPRRFFVETRAETVTQERVDELRRARPAPELAVELGLESSHDGVLAFCVNKGSGSATFRRAAELLRSHGILVYANVSLGTAFLDRATAMRDVLATVNWALANGADRTVVFPLHIKPYTMLDVLQKMGRYEPMSLWDLVEVLQALGPHRAARVEIAWYKSYYDSAAKVTRSPVGCERCSGWLVEQLDLYRATQRYEVILDLERSRCECTSERVLPSYPTLTDDAVAASIVDQYALLAHHLSLEDTWRRFEARTARAIGRAFNGFADSRSSAATAVSLSGSAEWA